MKDVFPLSDLNYLLTDSLGNIERKTNKSPRKIGCFVFAPQFLNHQLSYK